MRIITDSSANLTEVGGADFVSVPLTVMIGEKPYADTPELRVHELLREMDAAKGPTGTACPSVGDWLDAFGEEDQIFAVTLTGALSGCYGAALIAADQYTEAHPGRRVDVMDSRTTGPELELLVERFAAAAGQGMPFVRACDWIRDYRRRTHLAFMLTSLDNFARNGSAVGTLEPLQKCRGRERALEQLWKNMKAAGYDGGRVRIRHTENAAAAFALRRMILSAYPEADVFVGENRGLCAYYEHGGLLVGYEEGAAAPDAEAGR